MNRQECSDENDGRVLSAIVLAANVATLGLTAPETNTTTQTITVAGNAVAGNTTLG